MQVEPVASFSLRSVDAVFPLSGGQIPAEHSYALYGALSSRFPNLHEADWLGVHPIFGRLVADHRLRLTSRSELRLRVPVDRLGDVARFAKTKLYLHDTPVQVGHLDVRTLEPAAELLCPRVLFSHRVTEEEFAASLSFHLTRLGIRSDCALYRPAPSLELKGLHLVAFAVRLSGLSPDESARILFYGLGGKRRMGCGLFGPWSPESTR